MPGLKSLRIVSSLIKKFVFPSVLTTIVCLYLLLKYGFGIFVVMFWFKIVTAAMTFYFINTYYKNIYYYYYNLGISKLQIWATALIFDFGLFISLYALIKLIQ